MRNTIINIIPNLNKCEGEYGLEIEAEGYSLPRNSTRTWKCEIDGSLVSGLEAVEYVLAKPSSLEGIHDAIDQLGKSYKDYGTRIEETDTSGVHVHLNVQDYTMKEFFTLTTTYFALEELLIKFCGAWREGNHFCLRAKDAEWIIFELARSAKNRKLGNLNTDLIRYCSYNVYSIFKYGSVEFRAMRGTGDLEAIKEWINIIDALKNGAKKFNSPSEVLQAISIGGEEAFLRQVLGNKAAFFLRVPNYREIIRENLWIVQPLAFATNWNLYKDIKVNPFAVPLKDI